jgi:hypothetical protein
MPFVLYHFVTDLIARPGCKRLEGAFILKIYRVIERKNKKRKKERKKERMKERKKKCGLFLKAHFRKR